MSNPNEMPDFTMNADELYEERSFTDRRVGSLRQLTPVNCDGSVDSARSSLFMGNTQVYTPAGALPLSFEIKADNLADAISGYGEAAAEALEQTLKELEEMRREQAGSIMVPGGGGRGGMGGGSGMGGGGGSIQMP
jgi:hypothetical protein